MILIKIHILTRSAIFVVHSCHFTFDWNWCWKIRLIFDRNCWFPWYNL